MNLRYLVLMLCLLSGCGDAAPVEWKITKYTHGAEPRVWYSHDKPWISSSGWVSWETYAGYTTIVIGDVVVEPQAPEPHSEH